MIADSDPRIPGERFLHSPGPTHIPGEVLDAMHRQPMDHGDPRLDAVIAHCESGDGDEVFLYEIYDDEAAFQAHLHSAHFKAFAAATKEMITARRIVACDLVP